MKKIIILSALLISAICASPVAASWAKQNEIKGKLKSKIPVKDISLMSIVDGEPKVLSSSPIAEDGSFSIIFTADHEGFYAIGAQDMLKGQFPVYLKPGDAAEVNIEDKNIVFTQNNTPENLVLGKWSVLTQDLKSKSVYFTSTRSTYVDFFPELTAVAAQVEGFKKTIQTKNQKFNLVMKTQLGFDLDFYALNMLATPRSAHPAKTDYPAYYSTIVVKNRFPDDQVLNTLYGKRFMAMYVSFAAGQDKTVPEMLSPF